MGRYQMRVNGCGEKTRVVKLAAAKIRNQRQGRFEGATGGSVSVLCLESMSPLLISHQLPLRLCSIPKPPFSDRPRSGIWEEASLIFRIRSANKESTRMCLIAHASHT